MRRLPVFLWLASYMVLIALSIVPHLLNTPIGGDKVLHVTAWCCLMFPIAMLRLSWRFIIVMAVTLFATGAVNECIQYVVGGRQASFGDAFANLIGIALGVIIGRLIRQGWNVDIKTA